MNQDKKVGLVLSGGGYRGAAHIGVLKAMQERHIKPNFISGTSAGAIVGALYAAGISWEEIYAFMSEVDIFSIKNYTFQKAGLLDSTKFIKIFEKIFPTNRFEDLKIPLFIGTTDLVEAKTRFYFEGELLPPLVASASIPGMVSPIKFQNRLLCDGGVTNNLPVEPLIAISDKIIGVYVNPLKQISHNDLNTTREVLERSYLIMRNAISKRSINQCDVLIAPNGLNTFSILSRNNIRSIFDMGYDEACVQLDGFLEDNHM